MPVLSPRRIHRLTHRAIATVVSLSLLSMPVTYRGGGEAAHAHTVFQLWADVQSGSFTHHRVTARAISIEPHFPVESGTPSVMSSGVETSPPFAADDGHAAMEQGGMSDQRPDVDAMTPDHVVATDHTGIAPREPARGSPTGAVSVGPSDDAPRVGTAFTPSVRGTVLVLAATTPLLVAESFFSTIKHAHRMAGITDSPIAPPPRRAA